MSREIKFRGLSINGDWYYGNLSVIQKNIEHLKKGSFISNSVGMPFAYQVRPESVGQFTGLKDKNGVEIYEGDIVRLWDYSDEVKGISQIYYGESGAFTFNGRTEFGEIVTPWSEVEVIGNIYEKPELLEAK